MNVNPNDDGVSTLSTSCTSEENMSERKSDRFVNIESGKSDAMLNSGTKGPRNRWAPQLVLLHMAVFAITVLILRFASSYEFWAYRAAIISTVMFPTVLIAFLDAMTVKFLGDIGDTGVYLFAIQMFIIHMILLVVYRRSLNPKRTMRKIFIGYALLFICAFFMARLIFEKIKPPPHRFSSDPAVRGQYRNPAGVNPPPEADIFEKQESVPPSPDGRNDGE